MIETDIVIAKGWLIPSRAVSELYTFNEHETPFVVGLSSVEANVGGKTTVSSYKLFLPDFFPN